MSIHSLIVLLVIAGAVALWAHHSRISARARQYAQTYLESLGLQLLDQSVILESVRLSTYRGMPCLKRRFRFEFSRRGDRRYYGWVTYKAWNVTATEIQPFAEDAQN